MPEPLERIAAALERLAEIQEERLGLDKIYALDGAASRRRLDETIARVRANLDIEDEDDD